MNTRRVRAPHPIRAQVRARMLNAMCADARSFGIILAAAEKLE